MNFIVDFYKNLDAINLALFWGVIIVVILLLTFSIILAYKNRELKMMLLREQHNKYQSSSEVDIPIMRESAPEVKEETPIKIEEEKDFIAEEHVIEYSDVKPTNTIEQPKEVIVAKPEEEMPIIKEEPTPLESVKPNTPYQRNVLRNMSSGQTSPIGIVRKPSYNEETYDRANELQSALNDSHEYNHNNNQEYLSEVSEKLSRATNNDPYRTEYELKQEEEAIISYEELMQKKDSLHIVDEEEAVISIDELMEKKQQNDKLYNITKNEEDNNFIDELKQFRKDL